MDVTLRFGRDDLRVFALGGHAQTVDLIGIGVDDGTPVHRRRRRRTDRSSRLEKPDSLKSEADARF